MRFLLWILNSPAPVRRAVAWGIAGTLLATVAAIGIVATSALSAARQEVVEKREMLGQLQAVVALAETVSQRRPSEAIESANEFMSGDSDALIQSALQTRLGEIATENSVTVVSVGVAADEADRDQNYIGLRANLSGDLEGIHNTILALETNKPFLFIREAKIRATNVTAGAALAGPVELFAELVFYGARKVVSDGGPKP